MKPHREWELANGCIVGPKILRRNYSVQVAGTKISTVTETTLTPGKLRLNLKGLPVYPGLFNSYDHLLGTYLPKVGVNRPYLNWLPWDNDLKSSPVFAERQQLEPEQLYYLGCYRHLISGVTSVMDHIPHFVQEPFIGSMPIRILSNYNLAHSLCSFSLNWGDGPKKEYEDAKKNNRPFVIQISEGFDPETADSLKNLHALGALGEHTVLVHGLSFTNEDIRLVKESGASLVWCPSSNLFIFNKTVDIKSVLDAGINVCLGTDTSMSGSLNIFEEIRTAREHYRNEYGEELEPKKIFQMLTVNPASAFRVSGELGEIEAGKTADFVVLDNVNDDPYVNLCESDITKVKLVVTCGLPVFADADLSPFFDELGIEYEKIILQGKEKIINGSPVSLLQSIYRSIGYKKDLAFLPVQSG